MPILVQLEPNGLSKLPLLFMEAVKEIRTQFERCRHVQTVGCAGADFGGRLSRQLARSFIARIRQPPALEYPIAPIFLEVGDGLVGLRGRTLFSKDAQPESIDDFEFSKSSNKAFSLRSLHGARGGGPVGIRAVQRNEKTGIGVDFQYRFRSQDIRSAPLTASTLSP